MQNSYKCLSTGGSAYRNHQPTHGKLRSTLTQVFFKIRIFQKKSVHMETLGEKKHAKATDGDETILQCAAWCQKRRWRFPSLMLQDKNPRLWKHSPWKRFSLKLGFQLSKLQFLCGWQSKTHGKNLCIKKPCTCGQGLWKTKKITVTFLLILRIFEVLFFSKGLSCSYKKQTNRILYL